MKTTVIIVIEIFVFQDPILKVLILQNSNFLIDLIWFENTPGEFLYELMNARSFYFNIILPNFDLEDRILDLLLLGNLSQNILTHSTFHSIRVFITVFELELSFHQPDILHIIRTHTHKSSPSKLLRPYSNQMRFDFFVDKIWVI